jgi:hypothetical protein
VFVVLLATRGWARFPHVFVLLAARRVLVLAALLSVPFCSRRFKF